jgi:hypothetical protein
MPKESTDFFILRSFACDSVNEPVGDNTETESEDKRNGLDERFFMILSRVWLTVDGILDWMVEFIAHYTFTARGYR